MDDRKEGSSAWHQKAVVLILRGSIALNFVFYALSFSVWFEGTQERPGAADRLFGAYRLGGFRADIVWLVASTIAVIVVFFLLVFKVKKNASRMVDVFLCLTWIVAFFSFVRRLLVTGLLYMG